MLRTLWCVALVGCSGPTMESTVDATVQPDASHLLCPTTANSSAMVAGGILGFGALGNVDVGGESSCGGAHEGAVIMLAKDAARSELATNASFVLPFPIGLGPREITLFVGSASPQNATFYVTHVVPMTGGPDVTLVEGMFVAGASGMVMAVECAELTTSCI